MKTMTHTLEQREEWHAAKRTGKQRRADRRSQDLRNAAALRRFYSELVNGLGPTGLSAFSGAIARLGHASACVHLAKHYADFLAIDRFAAE